jgi:hypothetical protein
MAGGKILDRMFHSGPGFMPLTMRPGRSVAPKMSSTKAVSLKMPKFAKGGVASHVPIMAAGGEHVISPEAVMKLGNGDMDRGHRILDEFVKHVRKKTIKTLKKLPGPAKD